MVRDGAPPSLYEPGQASADTYNYNVFGGTFYFPFVIGVTEGNQGLESETADTYTAGFVFNLPGAERLTLAIDWYRIELENAIGIPGHDTIYQQCLDATYNSLVGSAPGSHTGAELAAGNPFCALIQREYVGGAPLTPGNYGADRKFSARYINQGGITSEGTDIQLDWGIGSFLVNFQGSILTKYEVAPFPGAAFIDYTGTINSTTNNSAFDYRLLSTVQYARDAFSVGMRWQHLPELDTAFGAAATALGVDSHDQIDFFGTYRFGDRWSMRYGIDNVTDEEPEWTTRTTTNNAVGTTNSYYDQIGRRVFVGVTMAL
jgi:outer membrane receptor protein involved in Fe transport